ncbi:MAG TPA: hypothetical protein VFP65_07180 [Anaeromyxobacteraceae bacterium]|nr:hypothetical protein [Anaeromyxobacteraceae bacterium]
MDSFIERVVRRLREEPGFSRNRHFLAFASAEGRRALRIHRHLRSIERDLAAGSEARITREHQRVRLDLRSKRGARTAYLTLDELRLLSGSAAVRSALGEALATFT